MANALTLHQQEFSKLIKGDGFQKEIAKITKSPADSARFTSGILSAVSTNPQLAECEPVTIINAGLMGYGLNLVPSPQLGYFYMVPFKDRKNNRTVATFILGYKGYKQLALRSGLYRRFNAMPVKEGELIKHDPFTEEVILKPILDYETRKNAPTIGYFCAFELLNGFKKEKYKPKQELIDHAVQYSKGYKNDLDKGTDWTFWAKDFDAMACKTMYRLMFGSGDAPLSVEMQKAYEEDTKSMEDFEAQFDNEAPASNAPKETNVTPVRITTAQANKFVADVKRNGIAIDFFDEYLMQTFGYMGADEIEVSNISTIEAWVEEHKSNA